MQVLHIPKVEILNVVRLFLLVRLRTRRQAS
jgi:hypothetical protein